MINKKHLFMYFLLSLCLIIVCMPRFNRKDIGFIKHFTSGGKSSSELLEDAGHYIHYVEYFRGINISKPIITPVNYRPFVPFIAAFLPFDPMTAINIINIFSLLLTLFFLNLLLYYLQFSFSLRIIGSLLFIFSFPTFYYGAIGYIDPVLIFFLMLGTYYILSEKWNYLIILLIIGAFVKETMVILIPVAFISLIYRDYSWKKKIILFVILSLSFFITYQLIRFFIPAPDSFFWWPSKDFFFGNIGRLKNWAGLILGFGFPGFISLKAFSLFKKNIPEIKTWLAPLLTGLLTAMALHFYAVSSALVDGRFIWTSYPFSIPLAVFVIDHMTQKFSESKKSF